MLRLRYTSEGRFWNPRPFGDYKMAFRYNRLWKLLIDRRMTKTQMRLAAGISTNVLAKMGKDEPVAIESLAKICLALNCTFDDIVEITSEREPVAV